MKSASPTAPSTARRFRRFIVPYKPLIRITLLCQILGVIIQLLLPWPMKFVVDHVLGTSRVPSSFGPISRLGPIGLAIIAALMGTALSLSESLLTYASSIASTRAGEFMARDMRAAMMRRLLALGPDFHERYDTGQLASRLGSDVNRVQDNVLLLATGVLPDVALLVGMLTVVTLIDARLALVVVVVVPPLMLMTRVKRRLTKAAQKRVRQAGARLESSTIEYLRHLRLAQMFTQEGQVRSEYALISNDLVEASLDGNRVQARFRPPTDLVLSLGAMVVIVFGVTQIRSDRLTTGTLLVVLAYLGSVYGPIRRLASVSVASAKAAASADRIDDVLCSQPSVRRSVLAARPSFDRDLRFEGVEARYPNGFVALSEVNLTIRPGERLCIVGRTGAGKSTLLSLIPRLIDPTAGAIIIDGVHLGAVDLDAWRHLVATVPQEADLFRGSIAENIAFGRDGVTWEAMIEAAQLALVDEFVSALPDGYDSIVGTDGTRLSGGQRRRVALARALVRQAPILLLDEPTAGLDALSEEFVIESIRRASIGRTCITVTHRTDLALESDRIVVLERGRVVELGTPESLLVAGGHFSRMRAAQQGASSEDSFSNQQEVKNG